MLPRTITLEDIPLVDHKDPTTRKYYAQMIAFENYRSLDTLVFSSPLGTFDNVIIHLIANHLDLSPYTRVFGNQRQVRIHRRNIRRASTLVPLFYDSKLIERGGPPSRGLKTNESNTSQWHSTQLPRSSGHVAGFQYNGSHGSGVMAKQETFLVQTDISAQQSRTQPPLPVLNASLETSLMQTDVATQRSRTQQPFSERKAAQGNSVTPVLSSNSVPPIVEGKVLASYSSPGTYSAPVGEVRATLSMTTTAFSGTQSERTTQSLTTLGPWDLRSDGRNVQRLITIDPGNASNKQTQPALTGVRAFLRAQLAK